MGGGNFKDLSGKEFIREVSDPLGGLLDLRRVDYGRTLKNAIAVLASLTRGLITVLLLEMVKKPIQFLIVNLDEFADFQVEYFL